MCMVVWHNVGHQASMPTSASIGSGRRLIMALGRVWQRMSKTLGWSERASRWLSPTHIAVAEVSWHSTEPESDTDSCCRSPYLDLGAAQPVPQNASRLLFFFKIPCDTHGMVWCTAWLDNHRPLPFRGYEFLNYWSLLSCRDSPRTRERLSRGKNNQAITIVVGIWRTGTRFNCEPTSPP